MARIIALAAEHVERALVAVVGEDARRPARIEHEVDDRVLHVDVDAEVGRVVLQRADQLEPGAVADVRQPRIAVAAEVALVDPAVRRAIEDGAPCLELAHAIGRFLRVDLRHAPVVDVLPAAHGVGKMHPPVVAVVVVAHGRRHAAFRHHGVSLAEERFADQTDRDAGVGCGLDRGAQAGTTRPDDQDVVGMGRVCIRGILETDPFRIEIRPDPHRAEADVNVGEGHGEETAPRKQLVLVIQRASNTRRRDRRTDASTPRHAHRPTRGASRGSQACNSSEARR